MATDLVVGLWSKYTQMSTHMSRQTWGATTDWNLMERTKKRRYAPDGGYYTAKEFYEYYGGWDEWYAAEEEVSVATTEA